MDELNRAIETGAAGAGALLLDLSGFDARNLVMADRVHPTAFGQIWIAERALAVLAGDGLPTRVRPSSLIAYEISRWGRMRSDLTLAVRVGRRYLAAGWDLAGSRPLASVSSRNRRACSDVS
jgi:hypothetical protein